MYTDADIEINGNVATLRDKVNTDKHITVEFTSNHPLTVGYEAARPLPTSPEIPEQRKNEGYCRLYARLEADGEVNITAKINANPAQATPVCEYDISIDEWKA